MMLLPDIDLLKKIFRKDVKEKKLKKFGRKIEMEVTKEI